MKNGVLIIREFDEFSRILAESGFEIINLPLIETAALADLSGFNAQLETIENYDGIFLTSRSAARIFAERLREKKIDFTGKVYILGRRSFDLLKREKLDLVFDAGANTAREFLEKIPVKDLKNKRFLFIRGEKSLRVVPEFLEKIAEVRETIVYQTRRLEVGIEKIREIKTKFEQNEILSACFFSPSAAQGFLEQFGAEILHQIPIATIGKTTAEFLEKRNIEVDLISRKATAADFAAELIECLGKNLTTDKHG